METLRIKCPSCGIVLEVRNSKNEKVKKITCPNCRKQLAVTFGELNTPVGSLYEGSMRYQLNEGANAVPGIPSGMVELRVVRLKDGTPKHILRALTDERQVKVNGLCLMQDDEVVLQRGDDLSIAGKLFSFDKPGASKPQPQVDDIRNSAEPVLKSEPGSVSGHKRKSITWLLPLFAVIAGIFLVVFLWPVNKAEQPKVESIDTIVKMTNEVVREKEEVRQNPAKPKLNETAVPVKPKSDLSSLDQYSLELKANKNDVAAQYELGQRLVHASGSKNVIMGINWLHKASLNGSSQARQLKNKAVRTLQNKAARGDSVAYSILQTIDIH